MKNVVSDHTRKSFSVAQVSTKNGKFSVTIRQSLFMPAKVQRKQRNIAKNRQDISEEAGKTKTIVVTMLLLTPKDVKKTPKEGIVPILPLF